MMNKKLIINLKRILFCQNIIKQTEKIPTIISPSLLAKYMKENTELKK